MEAIPELGLILNWVREFGDGTLTPLIAVLIYLMYRGLKVVNKISGQTDTFMEKVALDIQDLRNRLEHFASKEDFVQLRSDITHIERDISIILGHNRNSKDG